MRNLKKFLALVMAMVMALSLMVTANAATTNVTYTDSASVTPEFAEAVDVLSGMGVFHGDEDGFRPGSTITRAEVSAVIYRLATGDVNDTRSGLYATYQSFSDVPMDAWYAGYVGYLWNAGFVKGTSADTFSPDDNVTGYEVLAMILRAIGYDKNHEFEGAEWIVNVAALSTQLGILRDVKTAHFDQILHLGARRDVVASLLFNTAAYVPEVTYSALTGYNQHNNVLGTNGYNQSLGQRLFGLTADHGIVVGNQSTGESYTKIGFTAGNASNHPFERVGDYIRIGDFAQKPDYDAYIYSSANKAERDADPAAATTTNTTMSFIWDTDLRMFGHQVKVWYDYRNTINSNTNKVLVTYATYDEAAKTQVVKAGTGADVDDTAKGVDGKAINNDVGYMADKAGFKVNTVDGAYYNYAFAPTVESNRDNTSSNAYDNPFTSPILENNSATIAPYYLLISNSTEKENSLDMIISLDLTVTQISQQNDVSKPLSIGLNVGDADKGGSIYFGGDNATYERKDLPDVVDFGTRLNIAQENLVPYMLNNKLTDSSKTLGDQVVAIEITGTTDVKLGSNADGNFLGNAKQVLHDSDTSNYYYQTIKLTRQISGTVVKVDEDSHEVWFSDGTKLERSWLADTVSNNRLTNLGTDNETNIDKNVQRAKEPDAFGDYTFTLDDEGKYIFWSTEKTDTTFVYGTYLDYNTVTASSTFIYPLVNVRLDGKTSVDNVTKVWDPHNGYTETNQLFKDAEADKKGVDLNSDTYDKIALPKRDRFSAQMGAQVYDGQYIGYTLNDKGELKAVLSSENAVNTVKQGNTSFFGFTPIDDDEGSIVIGSTDVKIGAVNAGRDAANTGLYLTENTQFYLVSGAGTDNVKVDAYKGLSGLLGSNTKVIIHGEKTVEATRAAKDAKASSYWPLMEDIPNYEMIYWTQSPFHYAQDYATTAFQADTVILPLEAVEFVGGVDSSLYFIGKTSSTLYDADRDATQFTMYDRNGNEVSRWLEGKADDGATGKNSADAVVDLPDNVFVNLVATSDKAKDGNPIYKLATVSSPSSKLIGRYLENWTAESILTYADCNDDPTTDGDYLYKATTYTDQLATIGTSRDTIWNVSGAKVINLNTSDWPGVTSLTTLNAASSLESNAGIQVSCFLNSDNNKQASVIFVNYED